MTEHTKPRFRRSARFPRFVLAVSMVLMVDAGAARVWFGDRTPAGSVSAHNPGTV